MWDLIIFVVLIYVLVRLTILGSRYDEALEVATEVNQQYASGAEQEKFNVRLQRLEAELAELRGLSATASVVDRGGSPVTHVAREKIVTEVLPAEEDEGALDEFILPLHLFSGSEPLAEEPSETRVIPTAISPERDLLPAPQAPTAIAPEVVTPAPTSRAVYTPPPPARSIADLETMIGGEWLNKIGVAVLVIGISLALGYSFQHLGSLGKIFFGYAVSGVLLVSGILLEKKETYRLYAGGLIAGGWALGFFTTYAMHHIPSVRIIESPLVGLLLLYCVAGGVIGHSLKYRSEMITCLAYSLGFVTMAISHVTVFSLSASLILSASLVVLVWRMNWFAMAGVGLLAAYASYSLWLYSITHSASATASTFPHQRLSAVFLILFWMLFTLPNFLLKPGTARRETFIQSINLINSLLFFSLFAYQGRRPELRYLFLSITGFAYVGLGYLSGRFRRRTSYLIFTTIGIGLLVAAVPARFAGSPVTLLWLFEAEVFLFAGFFLKEVHFRRLAWLAFALAFIKLVGMDLPGSRFLNLSDPGTYSGVIVFALAAALFYANGHKVYAFFGKTVSGETEEAVPEIFSYGGAVLSLISACLIMGWATASAGWAICSLILFEIGRRWQRPELRVQSYLIALLTFFWSLAVLYFAGPSDGRMVLITAGLSSYLLAHRIRRAASNGQITDQEKYASRVILYAASILTTVFLWRELNSFALTIGWALFAVVLVEVGRMRSNADLRLQGYIVSILTFLEMLFASLFLSRKVFGVSPRVLLVAFVVLCFYYLFLTLRRHRKSVPVSDSETMIQEGYSYAAAAALLILALMDMRMLWVAVVWQGLALIFLVIGLVYKDSVFRIQSYLITGATLGLILLVNLGLSSERAVTIVPVIAILYGCTALLLRSGWSYSRRAAAAPFTFGEPGVDRSEYVAADREQAIFSLQDAEAHAASLYFYAATGLLTLLLALEVNFNLLTLAWGMEGLALFVVGLVIRERMFRVSGLILLLICILKIFFLDLRGLDTLERIFSFIGLGIILLLVSYLYTRHREFIGKLLR